MKQKLLNSFTWRASLLVAFLCCAFTSAWAADWEKDEVIASDVSIDGGDSQTFNLTITGYFIKIVVDCTPPSTGNGKYCYVDASVFESQVIKNKKVSNDGVHTVEYTDPSKTYKKNGQISVKITGGGNKPTTVNSITVTYTPAAIIEINSACKCQYDNLYYGTFSNSSPFVVPGNADFTVSEVSVSGGILDVNPLSGTQTVTIPANTGVLVSSANPGEKIVKLNDPAGSYTAPSNNMLQPSSEPMTSIEDYSDYYFYHLTFDSNNPLGFYWGYPGGGAWEFSGTNKAYLAVPKTDSGYSAVKGFTLSDSADGIKAIETEKNSEMVFNLAGQRVSKMQKGIYVVNGKKILVK